MGISSESPIVIIVGAIIIIGLPFWYILSSKSGKVVEEPSPVKEKEMVQIVDFDSDEYVNDIFNTVFYSIQTDNWDKEISWDHITLTKSKKVTQYKTKEVSIVFKYEFESKVRGGRIFVISDIFLKDKSGNIFTYKKTKYLSKEVVEFIYGVYSDDIIKKNLDKKDHVDKTLVDIKDVLGKSSERAAKLDELLG